MKCLPETGGCLAVDAYLRVSTDQQAVDIQRYGLLVYTNTHGLEPLQFLEDMASGQLTWRDRAVSSNGLLAIPLRQ